jgi:predicted RNA-binding protein with PUA-like domain
MNQFLVKTEPSEYAFEDLVRGGSCVWDGVSNPAACKAMRAMKPGDEVFIYHTGDVRAVVGLARVASAPSADPKQPGLTAAGEIKFPVVKLEALRAVKRPMTLAEFKADSRMATFALVTQARLSVMEVSATIAKAIRTHTGL